MGMKVKGSFLFMGTETTQSRDGKETYYKIGLMQGLDAMKFNVDHIEFKKWENIVMGTPVIADLEVSEFKEKTYFKIKDLQIQSLDSVNKKAV